MGWIADAVAAELLHSIKSFTANQINRGREATGPVWQREYYDRIIRNEADFAEKWEYLVSNPRRRGLGEDYQWVWTDVDVARGNNRLEGGPTRNNRLEGGATRDNRLEGGATQYPLPFRTCIVLGHIAGEDGNKMSKKLRNYKEPTYIFDTLGADAMRWYFLSAQAPWTSTRFAEAAIRDSQREFLVKLYNVLGFFTSYASIDGFDPSRRDEPGNPMGHRPTEQRGELDRWIVTELHQTVRSVRESMDRFENYPAAQRLNEFVESLSNWYVRRSRDRFWKPVEGTEARRHEGTKEVPASRSADPSVPSCLRAFVPASDQDKWDAYHTLYGCLRVFSRLIAPFTPFFAEKMHQYLRLAGDPLSVHLCDYPTPEEIRYCDESLAGTMESVRELVALGRAARTAAKLKVRQPLPLVEIVLSKPEQQEWLREHSGLIAEELNVKGVEFAAEADHYVSYKVVPNFPAIGKKYRALVPGIKAALGALSDPAAARKQLVASGVLALNVGGQTVELTPDEVEIRLEAKPGWAAAQGKSGVVVLSTEISPELREEGVVRELIHFVQAARKEQNLAYEARICLHLECDAAFQAIVTRFEETIKSECLVTTIVFGPPPSGQASELDVEGHKVKMAIVEV
ncbi:MAG: class I tRNA ligase family protein [Planctomycetes bacterium]|nr:class I tRNA ligase family protein [Planctomycetota bacterium]